MRKLEIREKLSEFVSYAEGESLREELEIMAKKDYKPKHHADFYLSFMNDHECSFKRNHPQGQNFPYVWTMFSVISQHVMGDCIQECLDNAIDKI